MTVHEEIQKYINDHQEDGKYNLWNAIFILADKCDQIIKHINETKG